MKVAIIYYSKHHGNTKKLLDAIASKYKVDLIDVIAHEEVDLESYEMIGFASGIYYSNFAKQVIEYAGKNMPSGKKVFFIATYGAPRAGYYDAIRKAVADKNCTDLGDYGCMGFDTFGPFKLVGGIAKGHPNEDEIAKAVEFYESIIHS